MAILLKIGGALLAPKDSDKLDMNYIDKVSARLGQYDDAVAVHGAGNVGYGFVETYGTDPSVVPALKQHLKKFWDVLDAKWGLTRITYDQISLRDGKSCVAVGGDISPEGNIMSGDGMFVEFLERGIFDAALMLTDVDGVLDADGQVIPCITSENYQSIHFWKKEGDSLGAMANKIYSYFQSESPEQGFWIVNGNNLQNVDQIVRTGKGVGTFICR